MSWLMPPVATQGDGTIPPKTIDAATSGNGCEPAVMFSEHGAIDLGGLVHSCLS